MRYGEICKSSTLPARDFTSDMQKINLHTRRELTADEVYIFPVALCNNDIDRDLEKFTINALNELAKMYIGKTGIYDHRPSTQNQVCRIFDTAVIADASRTTKDGEVFNALVAWAYILKTDANAGLIAEIDGGIKKEVSVGCAVSKVTCSICGKPVGSWGNPTCEHKRGKTYDGKLAFVKLDDPTDAYEFSFVAVPAQPEAGVTKRHEKGGEKEMFLNEEIQNKVKALIEDGKEVVVSKADDGSFVVGEIQAVQEPAAPFLTAEQVTAKAGKEVSAEEVLKLFDTVSALETDKTALASENEALKAKATQYDALRKQFIEDALKAGVKAKGERFDRTRWEKTLDTFEDLDTIKAQTDEWLEDAKIALKAGIRVSTPTPQSPDTDENPENYKV